MRSSYYLPSPFFVGARLAARLEDVFFAGARDAASSRRDAEVILRCHVMRYVITTVNAIVHATTT